VKFMIIYSKICMHLCILRKLNAKGYLTNQGLFRKNMVLTGAFTAKA